VRGFRLFKPSSLAPPRRGTADHRRRERHCARIRGFSWLSAPVFSHEPRSLETQPAVRRKGPLPPTATAPAAVAWRFCRDRPHFSRTQHDFAADLPSVDPRASVVLLLRSAAIACCARPTP